MADQPTTIDPARLRRACEAFLRAYGTPLSADGDAAEWVKRCVAAVLEAEPAPLPPPPGDDLARLDPTQGAVNALEHTPPLRDNKSDDGGLAPPDDE